MVSIRLQPVRARLRDLRRARYELTLSTQVAFVDEGGTIRLHVRRRVNPSDPVAGYGMVKVKPRRPASAPRRLLDFNAASVLERRRPKR
jgi:hypothetical protein